MTTLPPISQTDQSPIGKEDVLDSHNPFSMPRGINIFTTLRDQEKKREDKKRAEMLSLPIHLKGTAGRRCNLSAETRKNIAKIGVGEDSGLTEEQLNAENVRLGGVDAAWILKVTAGARRGGASAAFRSSRHDYIQTKRQMFFAQYGLSVKKNEMKNLENLAKLEQRKIEAQEVALEQDSIAFDKFLKDNDEKAVNAIKEAEKQTKIKLEKQTQIKNLILQQQTIKSGIIRYEEELQEILTYRKFLFQLSPKQWQYENCGIEVPDINNTRPNTAATVTSVASLDALDVAQFDLSDQQLDNDDIPAIYFEYPEEIIHLLHDLEEQNLCMIRNSQETEKSIEEVKDKRGKTEGKINDELSQLKTQIETLRKASEKEESRVSELKLSCKMYDMGNLHDEQTQQQSVLTNAVTKVYNNVIGSNSAQIDTEQMLQSIEAKLNHLFETIDQLPPDQVKQAEKARERERRHKDREERAKLQRKQQEERVKRALARAQEVYKKRVGKKLIFRSAPPASRQAKRDKADRIEREKENEQLAYFFS